MPENHQEPPPITVQISDNQGFKETVLIQMGRRGEDRKSGWVEISVVAASWGWRGGKVARQNGQPHIRV